MATANSRKASRIVDFPALFGPTNTLNDLRRTVKFLSDLKFRNLMLKNMECTILHYEQSMCLIHGQ